MLKTGMDVAEYFNVFNYGPPRQQKFMKCKDKETMAGTGVNPKSTLVLSGKLGGELDKNTPVPQDVLIMENLDT